MQTQALLFVNAKENNEKVKAEKGDVPHSCK